MQQKQVFLIFVTVAMVAFVLLYQSSNYVCVNRAGVTSFTMLGSASDTAVPPEEDEMVHMAAIHTERVNHVKNQCQQWGDDFIEQDIHEDPSTFLHDEEHGMVLCYIPKNGCSFWKRVFSIIGGRNNDSTVFNLSSVAIHTQQGHAFDKLGGKSFLQKYYFLQASTKFMFARDPYERLFSGYVDKFFAPCAMVELDKRIRKIVTKELQDEEGKVPGFEPSSRQRFKVSGRQRRSSFKISKNGRTVSRSKREVRKSAVSFLISRQRRSVHEREKTRPQNLHEIRRRSEHRIQYILPPQDERREGERMEMGREINEKIEENEEMDRKTRENTQSDRETELERERRTKENIDRIMNEDLVSEECPPVLSFSDFLRYVTNTQGMTVNPHFAKQHKNCFPCLVDYDFIGKLETFHEDADFILKSAGIDPSEVYGPEDSFEENSDLNIIRDLATRSFHNCPHRSSGYCMMQRTWATLQIRGYLSTDIPFPISKESAKSTTLQKFIEIAIAAFKQSDDREVVKRQRNQAMMEAYSTVPRALLDKLEDYVSEDCDLFGYNCSVASRFKASEPPRPIIHFEEFWYPDER